MTTKSFTLTLILLSSVLGAWAQQRIKTINVTIEIPKVGTDAMEEVQVTSVITDAFGSQNMLGEGENKIEASVQVVKFDDYGNPCQLEVRDVYEAGRRYKFIVHTTNFTDKLYNYKNDKNFTADNSTVKASINGQKANITVGSGRPLIFEVIFTLPGTRDPRFTNTSVSPADGQHAGFSYVDLGLPSGTKWATCNVGASKPEALGNKYAYGETKTKKTFTPENFIGYGAYTESNPYGIKTFDEEDEMYSVKSKEGRLLRPEYDAARQNMGGEWRLPGRSQCGELYTNCYVKYVRVNGVEGALYTSLINGKSIFLPFTEKYKDSKLGGASTYMTVHSGRIRDMYLYWWGSSYSMDNISGTCLFENYNYEGNEDELGGLNTYTGVYVRAVWGGKDNISTKTSSSKKMKSSKKDTSNNDSKTSKTSSESNKGKVESATKKLLKIGRGLKNILH